MMPVALLAGIVWKLGVLGIWIGCTAGTLGILVWYSAILARLDWEKVVLESHQRIEAGKNAK